MLSETELEDAIQGREATLVAALGQRVYNGTTLYDQYMDGWGLGWYTTGRFAAWLCNNFPGWVEEWVTVQDSAGANGGRE
jgi:hypothetical protein